MFENEVMSWQLFLFLHTCVICIDVQLILEQRYNFFMNEQKGVFHYCRIIFYWVYHQSTIYEFPDSVIRPFPLLVCESSTIALES